MANQPTSLCWSPVGRVDQADGGGVALVACVALRDPRLRLRACCTICRP